jgi:hypothetical protein
MLYIKLINYVNLNYSISSTGATFNASKPPHLKVLVSFRKIVQYAALEMRFAHDYNYVLRIEFSHNSTKYLKGVVFSGPY